jgi:hypothetical protein
MFTGKQSLVSDSEQLVKTLMLLKVLELMSLNKG